MSRSNRLNPCLSREIKQRITIYICKIKLKTIFFSIIIKRIEDFLVANEQVLNDLENLHVVLLEHKSARADESAQAMTYCAAVNADVKRTMLCTIEKGMVRYQIPFMLFSIDIFRS